MTGPPGKTFTKTFLSIWNGPRASGGAYMTAPHVESIFEGYYPWVVTMTVPLESGNQTSWVSLDLSFSSISTYINNVSIGSAATAF